ncbi:MAG: hypothetical protein ABIM89_09630 [Mycobacteriales bacterium]
MAIDARGPWAALEPTAASALFFALDASWWVTGGRALDLFLGRSLPHHDLDIAVLRKEQDAVRSHLAAWDLHAMHDGLLTPWPSGTRLPHDRSVVWGRTATYLPWQIKLLVENTEADEWVYGPDDRVRLPLLALGLETPADIPYVRPEVVLLHQAAAGADDTKHDADVAAVATRLTATGRSWLHDALAMAQPGHRWIRLLG